MLNIITQENAHMFGDAMPSMYRLRYRAFIVRQDYKVHSIRKMEYDAYDTPAAAYLVWRDAGQVVRGCTRLSPTTRPYMIQDLWPELVDGPLPSAPDVWEASRFCVDKDIQPELRDRIRQELVYGLQELGLCLRLRAMIGVMQPPIWKRVFINEGWSIMPMGEPKLIGTREKITAGYMPVSKEVLSSLQKRMNMPASILGNDEEAALREAA